jgi:rhamnosyltransferase
VKKHGTQANIAVLLATYNGERFVRDQIRSLKQNETRFTLHWIDDHSKDDTRALVESTAREVDIDIQRWQQPSRLGVPAVFFKLMESVEADIYLFCDQDDIWQPGKVDATVSNLLPNVETPVLYCSDFLMFRDDKPSASYRLSEITGLTGSAATEESRLFMALIANGHTQGFTRALRDIFMLHRDVAYTHAYMHDEWLHNVAVASGTVRFVSDVPTTLFRWHGNNTSGSMFTWKGKDAGRLVATWRQHQTLRAALARHIEGFILASETLPSGPKRERALEIAHSMVTIGQRQSPAAIVRMITHGMLWPSRPLSLGFATVCLCCRAPAPVS